MTGYRPKSKPRAGYGTDYGTIVQDVQRQSRGHGLGCDWAHTTRMAAQLFGFEKQRPQRREREFQRVGAAVGGFCFGVSAAEVAYAGAAVFERVAVE